MEQSFHTGKQLQHSPEVPYVLGVTGVNSCDAFVLRHTVISAPMCLPNVLKAEGSQNIVNNFRNTLHRQHLMFFIVHVLLSRERVSLDDRK